MKKIISLLAVVLCICGIFAGCSSAVQKEAGESASAGGHSDITEKEIVPGASDDLVVDEKTKKEIDETEVMDASVYFDWTIADWEKAETAEREPCVLTYIAMKNEKVKSDAIQTQNTNDVAEELEALLKENPDKTVKQLVEMAQ